MFNAIALEQFKRGYSEVSNNEIPTINTESHERITECECYGNFDWADTEQEAKALGYHFGIQACLTLQELKGRSVEYIQVLTKGAPTNCPLWADANGNVHSPDAIMVGWKAWVHV